MSYDLIRELEAKNKLLDIAITQFKKRGQLKAETERNYRMALRKELLTERVKGTPVTILPDICRGATEVANFKLERDAAEANYEAAREAINGYKLQIRILAEQISREWGDCNVK